ncbi:hypothetical protein P3S67_011892 [Capsicum chacoense]
MQHIVSRSSIKSEYRGLAAATTEITWLQNLLKEFQIVLLVAPKVWWDNLSATYLAVNPVFHARTKHIELDFHFVREKVASKDMKVRYISSMDQVADIMNKSLATHRFLFLKDKLAMVVPSLHLRGAVRIKELPNR